MPIERTGLLAGICVAGVVGGTAIIVSNMAQADPTPDDPAVYFDLNTPTAISSEFTTDTDGVEFTPLVKNTTEDPQLDLTIEIRAASPDEGADPSLRVESGDERCGGEQVITCTIDTLNDNTSAELDLRLYVDGDTWQEHPMTFFAAEMTGGASDTASASSYVHSQDAEDVERIDYTLPQSIPNDKAPGTEGVPVRFQLNNDGAQQLDEVTFRVDLRGLNGNDPSVLIGGDEDECEVTDAALVCEFDELSSHGSKTYETRLWVNDNYVDNYDTGVDARITWAGDDTVHTFDQRVEYAHVSPYDE